jgi:hypothetical protein
LRLSAGLRLFSRLPKPLILRTGGLDLLLDLKPYGIGRPVAKARNDHFCIRVSVEPGLPVEAVEPLDRHLQRILGLSEGIAYTRLGWGKQIGCAGDRAFDDLQRDPADRAARQVVDEAVPGTTDIVDRLLGGRQRLLVQPPNAFLQRRNSDAIGA